MTSLTARCPTNAMGALRYLNAARADYQTARETWGRDGGQEILEMARELRELEDWVRGIVGRADV